MTRAAAVLLCAGASTRMGFDKLTAPLCGRTAIERSMDALIAGGATAIICAVSERTRAHVENLPCTVEKIVVSGGRTRAESVKSALAAVPADADVVAVHDAARCFVSAETVRDSFADARRCGSGVVCAPMTDTVMQRAGEGLVPLDRDRLVRMQTPQTFRLNEIRAAYEGDLAGATDDCSVYVAAGYVPHLTQAHEDNFKLTTAADWARAQAEAARFGTGYDTHRLVEGRRLVLGGVAIPYEKGLLGHSDADVLVHAVMDALLGAAALGDIGKHFPDTDPAYEGADSIWLLSRVNALLTEKDYTVWNVDATVIAQRPKLAPYIDAMRENIARALNIEKDRVSVKATTTEGMNDEGKGLCISTMAIASLR